MSGLLAVKYKERHEAIYRHIYFNLEIGCGFPQNRHLVIHNPSPFMENDRVNLLYKVSHYSMFGEKSKPNITPHNKLKRYI